MGEAEQRVNRVAALWPVGEPKADKYYTSARFSIVPGVGNIANVGALGGMTAEVTRNTPSLRTSTAEVTHDSVESTSGIVYFGYPPDKGGQPSLVEFSDMKPTLEHIMHLIAPTGALEVSFLDTDPAISAPPQA